MCTLELKRALHRCIDAGDDRLVRMLYEKVKAYYECVQQDAMLAEGEADSKAGRVHRLEAIAGSIAPWEAA